MQRRLIAAEMAAGADSLQTPEQQRQVELMLRYKTTAERAFYRAWEALRGLSKDIRREKQEIRKVQSALADLQN